MKKVIAVTSLLMLISTSAMANDTKFRGGLDLGLGMASATGNAASLSSSISYALSGRLGYDVNRYLAVEGSWSGNVGPRTGAVNVSTSALTFDLTGFYPLEGKSYAVYGTVGYGRLDTTYSTNNGVLYTSFASKGQSGLKLGGGVEFGHDENFSLRLGVETYNTGLTRSTTFLVGPVKKF